jgi:hypothetical protein
MMRDVMETRNEFPQKPHEMPAPVLGPLSKTTEMVNDAGEHKNYWLWYVKLSTSFILNGSGRENYSP